MWPFSELRFELDERPVTAGEVWPSSGEDLLSRLGTLLAENERLTVTAQLLERARGESDELESLVRRLLPILDGFERILAAGREMPDNHSVTNWLRTVETLYFRLKSVLEKCGLFGIEAVGQPVNLDLHEVVAVSHSADRDPGTIVTVRQRGYVFRGRLLREAQVVIAAGEGG